MNKRMNRDRPIIGITMGDPAGIGPEIIHLSLCEPLIYEICRPVVFGDAKILHAAKEFTNSNLDISVIEEPDAGLFKCGTIDVISLSGLDPAKIDLGRPYAETGRAMIFYINAAIDMAKQKRISAIVTCPVNKTAMQLSGSKFHGHTELLAERTNSADYVMMLAGDRLRVVLVTIHTPLKSVPLLLSPEKILKTIRITGQSLQQHFGIDNPRIAVAGLNPHAGEGGMFGDEEKNIILPAVEAALNEGFNAAGPFPPDTIFYHAAKGDYDAVVCMYHDQGLIPFKLMHFNDGVNMTLGLPIIRTSVDHGTAYDIAGTGKADPGSLIAAIQMAVRQAECLLGLSEKQEQNVIQ